MSVEKSVGEDVLRFRSFSGSTEYAESMGREMGSVFGGVFLMGAGRLRSFLERRREKPVLGQVSRDF